MSVNCIRCATSERTGGDLLCDACRAEKMCEECGGECCRHIAVPVPAVDNPDMQWVYCRGKIDADGLWRVEARCKHLGADNKCAIYETRPQSCQNFKPGGAECRKAREYGRSMGR